MGLYIYIYIVHISSEVAKSNYINVLKERRKTAKKQNNKKDH